MKREQYKHKKLVDAAVTLLKKHGDNAEKTAKLEPNVLNEARRRLKKEQRDRQRPRRRTHAENYAEDRNARKEEIQAQQNAQISSEKDAVAANKKALLDYADLLLMDDNGQSYLLTKLQIAASLPPDEQVTRILFVIHVSEELCSFFFFSFLCLLFVCGETKKLIASL